MWVVVVLSGIQIFLLFDNNNDLNDDEYDIGVIYHSDPSFDGYTLVTFINSTHTYLIDNNGKIVHEWATEEPGLSAYLMPHGDLLRTVISDNRADIPFHSGGESGKVQQYTWDGELIWEFEYLSEKGLLHHGIEALPNGNILMIAWERKTAEEAVQAGRDPALQGTLDVWVDYLIEVKPTGKTSGEIVWQWHVWDHLIQDHHPDKPNYGTVADHPERINLNFFHTTQNTSAEELAALQSVGYLGGSSTSQPGFPNPDWTHINAVSYNPELDQIALSVREFNEIWIIDHSTSTAEATTHHGGKRGKGGDLLYRWGNPMAYNRGTSADQTLFAQHDVQWVDAGNGKWNHILFNNGKGRKKYEYSSVIEMALPIDEQGNYFMETPKTAPGLQPVWKYTAPEKTDLYSPFLSGTQRLPNGNTLICDGMFGSVLEVTPSKQVVWKYIFPVEGYQFSGLESTWYRLGTFSARKYAPDSPQLTAQRLIPKESLETRLNPPPENDV